MVIIKCIRIPCYYYTILSL